MAALDNNSTALLAAVRRDCFLASSDDNWTSDRIFSVADDCTLKIAAALKRVKQDWFQEDFDVPLVANQAKYDVPQTAMWSSIENGFLIDKTNNIIVSVINNVSSSNRYQYQSGNTGTTGNPIAMWLNQSQIVLTPVPDSNAVASYSMTISAYRRPGQIVPTTSVVNVTAVSSVTQQLTIAAIPSTWTMDTYTSGTPYFVDVYSRNLPNTMILRNRAVTSPSATALAFSPSITAADFAKISKGDVVTMTMMSPYPDLPPEGVPYLREMVQKTILTAQTDSQALQVYLTEKADEAANFIKGMSNRHDGRPKRLSLYNAGGSSFIRKGFGYGGGN